MIPINEGNGNSGPFDYMQYPLDFCLYPDEIVERFSGKEVIVISLAKGDSDAFIETFKDKLKIKCVAQMKYNPKLRSFYCTPALSLEEGKPPITNLNGLLAVRKDEPIFLFTRIFWLELIEQLERKGLVRGEDVFMWEKGYPMTPILKKFIEHNERLWKPEKIKSKNKVLIPFSRSSWWFDAGLNISYAYVGNYLAQRYDAEIHCFLRALILERELITTTRTTRDIWRSFNTVGIFSYECDRQQAERAKEILENIWPSLNTWEDLRKFELEGINFGYSIIRDILRYNVPYVDMKSTPGFRGILQRRIQRIVVFLDYFNQHDDIKAICLCDGVSNESYLRDIAVAHGIPTYALIYGTLALKLEIGTPNNGHFKFYKKFFEQLSPKEQEIGLEWAKKSLDARLQGDTKDIKYISKSIYSVEAGERALEQNEKLKVIICPHTLYDDIHCGWSVFGSMIEWLIHLGELSNKTDYDWYLKIHPNAGQRDESCLSEFVKHYPRIKMVKKWTSPKQMREEGVRFAFTMYGTLGHEYPALGIQVINAGNNPHIAFDFCHNPKTPEEFDDIVSRLPELADQEVDMQEIYKFYCIHYLYYKHPSRSPAAAFFRRPELYWWITDKQRETLPPGIVNRHKYYLNDWSPEFHDITKEKVAELFKEMDERRDGIFYRNDEKIIKQKLKEAGMSVE